MIFRFYCPITSILPFNQKYFTYRTVLERKYVDRTCDNMAHHGMIIEGIPLKYLIYYTGTSFEADCCIYMNRRLNHQFLIIIILD